MRVHSDTNANEITSREEMPSDFKLAGKPVTTDHCNIREGLTGGGLTGSLRTRSSRKTLYSSYIVPKIRLEGAQGLGSAVV